MSDETIIVKNQGTIFLGGPPLVKAATGEEVTAEELGGGEVHASISGVADHLAENDEDALRICRDIFETIQIPHRQPLDIKPVREPNYPIEELYGLIPESTRESYLMFAKLLPDWWMPVNFLSLKKNTEQHWLLALRGSWAFLWES